jgi:hypothetical protein
MPNAAQPLQIGIERDRGGSGGVQGDKRSYAPRMNNHPFGADALCASGGDRAWERRQAAGNGSVIVHACPRAGVVLLPAPFGFIE